MRETRSYSRSLEIGMSVSSRRLSLSSRVCINNTNTQMTLFSRDKRNKLATRSKSSVKRNIHIHIHLYTHIYIHIYIYREREPCERKRENLDLFREFVALAASLSLSHLLSSEVS